jgi:hypothetical protein
MSKNKKTASAVAEPIACKGLIARVGLFFNIQENGGECYSWCNWEGQAVLKSSTRPWSQEFVWSALCEELGKAVESGGMDGSDLKPSMAWTAPEAREGATPKSPFAGVSMSEYTKESAFHTPRLSRFHARLEVSLGHKSRSEASGRMEAVCHAFNEAFKRACVSLGEPSDMWSQRVGILEGRSQLSGWNAFMAFQSERGADRLAPQDLAPRLRAGMEAQDLSESMAPSSGQQGVSLIKAL